MTEAALFVLVDVVQTFANVEDAVFVFLSLFVEFAQVFVTELTLEEIGVLDALLLATQHETDLLDTTLDELLQENEDDRTYHTVSTGDGEKVLFQGTGGRI